MNYKNQFDNLIQKKPQPEQKWNSIIKSHIKIYNDIIYQMLTDFFCGYGQLEELLSSNQYQNFQQQQLHFVDCSIPSYNNNIPSYNNIRLPADFINCLDALKLFNDDINNFVVCDTETKYNIVNEYYNAVTKKTGFLLESGKRIENGEFLDQKEQEKIDNMLKKLIESRIEYLLVPENRIYLDRGDKLASILKK